MNDLTYYIKLDPDSGEPDTTCADCCRDDVPIVAYCASSSPDASWGNEPICAECYLAAVDALAGRS
jgi:hypothetical protein